MHRLLHKMWELGYVECEADTTRYSVAPRLTELGGRLADVGGHSPPLRALMTMLRQLSGGTVSIWVPTGVHVRLSAMLLGRIRGRSTHAPGEIREPFSTPGLAIAATWSRDELRRVTTLARRREVPFGRDFKNFREVTVAISQVTRVGYAVGFNLRLDGWGVIAWPVPITLTPRRFGAVAIGLPVSELRRREHDISREAAPLLREYRKALQAYENEEAQVALRGQFS
jgi:DNA-binding IclR family transcriptional regulator